MSKKSTMPTEPSPVGTNPATGSNRTFVAVVGIVLFVALAIPLTVVATLIPGVWWWIGLIVAGLITAVIIWRRMNNRVTRILEAFGAEPVDARDHARFCNLVQGLCLAAGIPEPQLWVVNDDARNMASLHDGPFSSAGSIVVTDGLLAVVERVELEGLVSEAISRLRSGDARTATLAHGLLAPAIDGPLQPIGRPLAGFTMGRLFSEARDLDSDQRAVRMTRYPPGLVAAFATVQKGAVHPASSALSDRHLWLISPTETGGGAEIVSRASLELRMDALSEL